MQLTASSSAGMHAQNKTECYAALPLPPLPVVPTPSCKSLWPYPSARAAGWALCRFVCPLCRPGPTTAQDDNLLSTAHLYISSLEPLRCGLSGTAPPPRAAGTAACGSGGSRAPPGLLRATPPAGSPLDVAVGRRLSASACSPGDTRRLAPLSWGGTVPANKNATSSQPMQRHQYTVDDDANTTSSVA